MKRYDNKQPGGGLVALGAVAAIAFFFGRSSADPPLEVDAAYSSDEGASLNVAMPGRDDDSSEVVREPAPFQAPQPLYQPRPAAVSAVYFANCSQARAAGAAPVRSGDPGYAPHLDRDSDGVGCE